jgi:hypothetical protein
VMVMWEDCAKWKVVVNDPWIVMLAGNVVFLS